MTKKIQDTKFREIENAMKAFPAEVRRQEREYRHEMKIRKAFGKIDLHPVPRPKKHKTTIAVAVGTPLNTPIKSSSKKQHK